MFKVHRKSRNRGEIRYDDFGIHSDLVGVIHIDDKDRLLEVLKRKNFRENATWYHEFSGEIEPGDFLIDEDNEAYILLEEFQGIRKMHNSKCEIYYAV